MVYTATTFKYAFDYKESDVYWYSGHSAPLMFLKFYKFLLSSNLLVLGLTSHTFSLILGAQLTVVGLPGTVMSLMDPCLMEQQLLCMRG